MAKGHEYFSTSNRFTFNIYGYISTHNTNLWFKLYVKQSRTQCTFPVSKGYCYRAVHILGVFLALPLFIYWYVPLFPPFRRSYTSFGDDGIILSHYWKLFHDHKKFRIKAGFCFNSGFVESFSFICITHRYLKAVCSENKTQVLRTLQHLRHELEGL